MVESTGSEAKLVGWNMNYTAKHELCKRNNMEVYSGLDWQLRETQEVLCPWGSRAQGRSKSREKRGEKV